MGSPTMKKDSLVCLFFLILTLLFFAPFLTGEWILGFKDLSRYFYPLRYLMVEQVQGGYWPLWNPYLFCGFPLLATLQVGCFYPLTWVHYFLPFNLAFNYFTILHYFLAACFMFALLRHYNFYRASAVLGGLLFGFSGYLLSVSNMNTSLEAVIWLPLTILFFDRWLKERGFLNLAGLAVCLALEFLGGEPTILYVTVWLLLAYTLVFSGNRRRALVNYGGLALAGLLAAGITAVQLLPFLELARLSDRTTGALYELVTMRSLPPRELINFIFPYFFGNPAQFGNFTEVLIGRDFQDWLISPYLGILPLVFATLAFSRRQKLALFWLGSGIVGLLLAFGSYTVFYHLAYFLPGLSLIRYPVKYLFLVNFCCVWLAAAGFDNLLLWLKEEPTAIAMIRRWLLIVVFSLALAAALLIGFKFQLFSYLISRYPANLPAHFFFLLNDIMEFNLFTLLVIVANLFVVVILLDWASRGKLRREIFAAAVIGLIALDLFANSGTVVVPARADIFRKLPESLICLENRPRLGRLFYMPAVERANRVTYGENYNDALWEAKDSFTANWPILHHFPDFYGYESIKPQALLNYYRSNFGCGKFGRAQLNQLSAYNVQFIVSVGPLKFQQLRLLRHKNKFGRDFYLYENQGVLPRAYLILPGKQTILDLRAAKIVKDKPDEVLIRVKTQKMGILFLADSYYPGWRAWVDGREVKIEKADGLFRSVLVADGEHLVRFHYEPWSFYVGGIISLVTLGLILVAVAVG